MLRIGIDALVSKTLRLSPHEPTASGSIVVSHHIKPEPRYTTLSVEQSSGMKFYIQLTPEDAEALGRLLLGGC